MKAQWVRMDFTPKELRYFLFRKKRCPRCGGKMDRSKSYEIRYGREFPSRRDVFAPNSAEVRYYFYVYTCRKCGAQYSLKALSGEEEDR